MALDHTPLSDQELPAAIGRMIGPTAPGPARMMAARGLAPMGPKDLVTALYQLGQDTDGQISGAARRTADGLPDNILLAALGEPLDVRVLDFFAPKVVDRPALIEKLLLNPAVHDATLVSIAGKLSEREVELLAGNQMRLLSCPAIIEAVYFNKKARMSTVDRLLEMAVRNGLILDAVPQFKGIAASILGKAPAQEPQAQTAEQALPEQAQTIEDFGEAPVEMDSLFDAVLAEGWDQGPVGSLEYDTAEESEENTIQIAQLSVNAKIRLATLGNLFHRAVLIRDTNRLVAMAAITSPGVNEQEAMRYAGNRSLREEVIRYIANRKEWLKSYQVKVALANNPKTPLAQAMRLLPLLRKNDVRQIARSKNVPTALAKQAKTLSRSS